MHTIKQKHLYSDKTHTPALALSTTSRLKEYAALTKMRLSGLVLFSAVFGYLIVADVVIWSELLALCLGGFLVTGSSNGINQIIEKDLDKLMTRTQNRPIPNGRLTSVEAIWVTAIMGVAGIAILWFALNPLSGLLGALALLIYTALYTPMKRITPWAVFVGAIPGAIPPMLGAVAATGEFGLEPGILFAIQFMWQFPHFWAIAWKIDEDYSKAGFRLLPSAGGKNKSSAFQILVYTLFLIPTSLLPNLFHMAGWIYMIAALILGTWFLLLAIKLYQSCTDKAASKLMFASFFYLPILLIFYFLDKL